MNKPTVKLLGGDGNIFFILGKCVAAARREKWTVEEIAEFREKVTNSDSYDSALQVIMEHFEVE